MRRARPVRRLTPSLLAALGPAVTVLISLFGLARPRERRLEALAWLARLKRGLREGEGPRLLEWLRPASHRKRIARMAAEWHEPEILAALGEIFPIDPEILKPPRPGRSPLVSAAIALSMPCAVLLFILVIHAVIVLRASHYIGDQAIHVLVFFLFTAPILAILALLARD